MSQWARRVAIAGLLACLASSTGSAETRQRLRGLVLGVDAAAQTISVSCEAVAGLMPAMVMSFSVRDAATLAAVKPGASVEFTWIRDGDSSSIDDLRVRAYRSLEEEPLEFRRLQLLNRLSSGSLPPALEAGRSVPDFTLTDQEHQPIALSSFEGKVVALTFTYVRCPNPTYCFRLASNFSQLQRRFASRMGTDLVLLTLAIDPNLDRGAALADYAQAWTADARAWHFLTGPVDAVRRTAALFGVAFWQNDGLVTHSFHTAVIDRRGVLVANLDGNEFSGQQLGDLVETALKK
jgi:protein SCO1/2